MLITSLVTIAILHWAVLLVPGFNFVLIGQLAASGSRRAALAAVVGMTTATFIWATLAVAGIGAVFAAHPAVRQAVQALGGLYLLYLAFGMLRSGAAASSESRHHLSSRAAFRAGFVTSALNPKIALFYGSVFAAALPASPNWTHIVLAVLLVYANSWLWHGGLAFALSQPRVQSAYTANYRTLTRVAGLLVGAFGARLIFLTLHELRARSSGTA